MWNLPGLGNFALTNPKPSDGEYLEFEILPDPLDASYGREVVLFGCI